MTFELSTAADGASATGAGAATGSATTTGSAGGSGGGGGGASGSTSGACCSVECPIAALMFSHTIGRGSTEPTIWFSTPSRYSQAWTSAVYSVSTAIMVSTCARSS